MAQLTHQNPMEPMDDGQMMSQFSQLSSLSQLQSIGAMMAQNTAISQTAYAASLIGKEVKIYVDENNTVQGTVSSITTEKGTMMVTVDDKTYPLGDVVEILGDA